MKKMMQKILSIGFAAGLLLPSLAMADDLAQYRDNFRQYQHRLDTVKQSDTKQYATEVTQIMAWIEESLVAIGKEDKAKVKALNLKTDVYLSYVEAGLKRDDARKRVAVAESKLKELVTKQGALEGEVQTLSAQEAKLQQSAKTLK